MATWTDNILDSHCHLWELSRFQYPWPTPELSIYKDHHPQDLWAAMKQTPVREAVIVQCLNDSPEEAKWVMSLAKQHPYIRGIVAGLDPSNSEFERHIAELQKEVPLLVGFRHILDLKPRKDYLLLQELAAGINKLPKYDLTFDLLLRPPNLEAASSLLDRVSQDTKLVVDHLAKPYIAQGRLDPWREHIASLARHTNVYCKLSGMVTEADLDKWKVDDLRPYVEHVLSVFGPDRVMFGSDWPVCGLARDTDYRCVFSSLQELLQHLPDHQQEKIFCTNARTFYNIK